MTGSAGVSWQPVSVTQQVLELVGAHCDLEERLAKIPPAASVRGMYPRSVLNVLQKAGRQAPYLELFGTRNASAIRFYPLSEYLLRLAAGGAILASPAEVHEGMFEISRRNALMFAESLLGRTMLRVLSPDPARLMRQAVAAQRSSTNYAQWTLDLPSDREAVMNFRDEYNWIEWSMLGAARGTFETIDQPVEITVELTGPFEGRHIMSW